MKIRDGFVSNSSSSSFVCSICEEVESGYEVSAEDLEMVKCSNDHVMHKECLESRGIDLLQIEQTDSEDGFDSDLCPCCNFDVLDRFEFDSYVKHVLKIDQEKVRQELKQKYGNVKRFYSEICKDTK